MRQNECVSYGADGGRDFMCFLWRKKFLHQKQPKFNSGTRPAAGEQTTVGHRAFATENAGQFRGDRKMGREPPAREQPGVLQDDWSGADGGQPAVGRLMAQRGCPARRSRTPAPPGRKSRSKVFSPTAVSVVSACRVIPLRPVTWMPSPSAAIVTSAPARRNKSTGATASNSSNPSAKIVSTVGMPELNRPSPAKEHKSSTYQGLTTDGHGYGGIGHKRRKNQ
jgi:hypothetical protein